MKKIATNYQSKLFLFDVLSTTSHISTMFHLSKTNIFIFRLFSLLRIFRLRTFNTYLARFMMRINVNQKFVEIFYILVVWMVCIHWTACLFVLPGLVVTNFFSTESQEGAWYEEEVFQLQDLFGKYVICLFKSVRTLMGVSYVENFSETSKQFEKVYVTLMTVLGRVGLAITLAYVYHLVRGVKNSRLTYDEMTVEVAKYVEHNRLPPMSRAKLKKNYEYIFLRRCFNEQEILDASPASLNHQILIHNTRRLVENSPFFQHLPWYLVMRIISALRVELFSPNDAVLTFGEIGKSIYFITSGSVALYSPRGYEICHLSDGDFFGETTLVATNIEHQHMKVVALEMTKCYKWVSEICRKLNNLIRAFGSFSDSTRKIFRFSSNRIQICSHKWKL